MPCSDCSFLYGVNSIWKINQTSREWNPKWRNENVHPRGGLSIWYDIVVFFVWKAFLLWAKPNFFHCCSFSVTFPGFFWNFVFLPVFCSLERDFWCFQPSLSFRFKKLPWIQRNWLIPLFDFINPLSASPTKWLKTLKQFVVSLTILWSWRLKG